jgi:hypothetical protein
MAQKGTRPSQAKPAANVTCKRTRLDIMHGIVMRRGWASGSCGATNAVVLLGMQSNLQLCLHQQHHDFGGELRMKGDGLPHALGSVLRSGSCQCLRPSRHGSQLSSSPFPPPRAVRPQSSLCMTAPVDMQDDRIRRGHVWVKVLFFAVRNSETRVGSVQLGVLCSSRCTRPLTFDLVLNCLPVALSNLPTPCIRSEADTAGS